MELAPNTTIEVVPPAPQVVPVYQTRGEKGDAGAPGGSDAAFAAFVDDPASATRASLTATYVPKWQPNTAYAAGDRVVNPSGDIVLAKTAFTSGATYDATKWNFPAANRRGRPKVALLGDSISNQNGDISSAAFPATNAKGYFTWANVLLNAHLSQVYNTATDDEFGTSGQTTGQILGDALPSDDLTAAVNSTADVMIVHAGTNDIGAGTSAATVAANLQAIWDALLNSGKTVVATTILPRAFASDTVAMRQALVDANRLIRTNARNTRGVVLCDWYPALLDASTGLARTAFFADTIHPNAVGASRMGKVLADVLAPLFPGYVTPELSMSTVDTKNVLAANGLMVGTTGTASAPSTGQVATGWSVFVDGAPTSVTASKVARSDLMPGEWQQVVVVAVTATSDGYHLQWQNTNVGVDWAVGDTVRAAIEFQTDAAGWDVRDIHLALFCYNNTGQATGLSAPSSEINALTIPLARPVGGVITTPSVVVPTGTTRLQVQAWQKGSGTIRWGRAHLLKNA